MITRKEFQRYVVRINRWVVDVPGISTFMAIDHHIGSDEYTATFGVGTSSHLSMEEAEAYLYQRVTKSTPSLTVKEKEEAAIYRKFRANGTTPGELATHLDSSVKDALQLINRGRRAHDKGVAIFKLTGVPQDEKPDNN